MNFNDYPENQLTKFCAVYTVNAQSIVLKLCGYAAAFRPDVGGEVVPQVGGYWRSVRGVEMSLLTVKLDN